MRKILPLMIFLCFLSKGISQEVMMQGWYWDYPKTADGHSWADTLIVKAPDLAKAGINNVWLPPYFPASFGAGSNGYDPQDLYIGNTTTGYGTRAKLDESLSVLNGNGINVVSDLIYNHRDGGVPETNPAVKDYITNHFTNGKSPFPSDRYRVVLPVGGNSGNGAGEYYFQLSSKTGDFKGNEYIVYATTNTLSGSPYLGEIAESEPNGGGGCGQGFDDLPFNTDIRAYLDESGCTVDEFRIVLNEGDFDPEGDQIIISTRNTNGNYSDHRFFAIFGPNGNIVDQLQYETFTDFSDMPSGQGIMNFEYFKPNSSNASTTTLSGDFDSLLFFYDYDHNQQITRDALYDWTKWNFDELAINGIRMDAVKHFPADFVGDLLDKLYDEGYTPPIVVGEFFDTNAGTLGNWVNEVLSNMDEDTKAALPPKVFDFSLRNALRAASDDFGYDSRNIFNSSLRDASGLSGFNVVTFVNNHDFRDDNGGNSLIKNDWLLGYAYILTNNQLGVPTVFYPDYYGYPQGAFEQSYHPANKQGYVHEIDDLIQVLQDHINGATEVDYLNRFNTPYNKNLISGADNAFITYQLKNADGKAIIVAINYAGETLRVDHEINTYGGEITSGTRFTDIIKNSAFPFAQVDGSNRIYMEVPARSYSVWVQGSEFTEVDAIELTGTFNGPDTTLSWTIDDEKFVESYTIQYSEDGGETWQDGTTVNAINDGTFTQSYTANETPSGNVPTVIYRVKVNYNNGQDTFASLSNEVEIAVPTTPSDMFEVITGTSFENGMDGWSVDLEAERVASTEIEGQYAIHSDYKLGILRSPIMDLTKYDSIKVSFTHKHYSLGSKPVIVRSRFRDVTKGDIGVKIGVARLRSKANGENFTRTYVVKPTDRAPFSEQTEVYIRMIQHDRTPNAFGFIDDVSIVGYYNGNITNPTTELTTPKAPFTEEISVRLYPNPTAKVLTVSGATAGETYSISSVYGRHVGSGVLDSSQTVDLGILPNGIYLISIYTKQGKVTKRVIKE